MIYIKRSSLPILKTEVRFQFQQIHLEIKLNKKNVRSQGWLHKILVETKLPIIGCNQCMQEISAIVSQGI